MINFYLYIVMGSTGILLPNYALLSVVLILIIPSLSIFSLSVYIISV